MPTAMIKSIERQAIMSDEDFAWVKAHLNKPLTLSCVDYFPNGSLYCVTVRKGKTYEDGIVLIFKEENKATLTIRGVDRRYE